MSDDSLFADLETSLKQAIDHATGKQKVKTTKFEENENEINDAEFAEPKTVSQENEKK